ncbi:MAG TPA: UDP-N-acetylmuramoyl-tripeptide--D-alanyl-D-alanine ligase [Patescibacteria group bacterium]
MIIRNLIYILQSENYYFSRFLKFAYSHLEWWELEQRQKITWTAKARLLQIITWAILISASIIGFSFFGWYGFFIVAALLALLPFVIGISLVLIMPVDEILKNKRIGSAKSILSQAGIEIVGITGSYGKTSTKEILAHILEKKFSVIKTPENVNTDIGIADFIIRKKEQIQKSQVFIVEMGAYCKGEIAAICNMVKPDYSILTGINEAHLERFGNIDNTIQTKFELPQNTKALSVLNLDDVNVRDNSERFDLKNTSGISLGSAGNIEALENFKGLKFSYDNCDFQTKLLAEHNITLILLCSVIAKKLGMSMGEISDAVSGIKPVAHRLEPLYNSATNVMVIDDSYNGNFDGIKSGIKVLSRAGGRKLVLTPGIVELGDAMPAIHREIGRLYAHEADQVLLIKSPMTPYIIEGLQEEKFENLRLYENTEQAHADLGSVIKSGDTIIFQNDLTDNYF